MENQTETKNPNGESKGGGNGNKVLLIIGGVILGFFVLAVIAFLLVFNTVKDAVEAELENEDGFLSGLEDEVSFDLRRDLAVEEMLSQYELVVEATADDVSWEEYLDELNLFIAELEALHDIDPDPLLTDALALFNQSREEYEVAVNLEDPDAPIDEAGVETAGVTIGLAQDKVNEYLDQINY